MKENGQRSREKIRIWICPTRQVYLHYYQRLRRDEVGCVEICVSLGLRPRYFVTKVDRKLELRYDGLKFNSGAQAIQGRLGIKGSNKQFRVSKTQVLLRMHKISILDGKFSVFWSGGIVKYMVLYLIQKCGYLS